MSFDRLQARIDEKRNPTVVGLDPELGLLPPQLLEKHCLRRGETLEAAAEAVLEWCRGLIGALCGIVPAVKPQSAFFEMLGPAGVRVLKDCCDFAREKGMYVICDAKRGDIGSTAAGYSEAYLGTVRVRGTEQRPFYADALTVNAYLGSDGVKPFLETAKRCDNAIFALVKTSNPSSGEFQDKLVGERRLYEAVGDMLEELSSDTAGKYGYTRVGAVVGATYPEELTALRKRLSKTFFLVPGYGAQGGTAEDVACAFDSDGRGAVINSSRGIIAAWKKNGSDGSDYLNAARQAAIEMREKLRQAVYR